MTHLTIEKIHTEKSGKVSDKWASYLPVYDALFEKYRTEKINLLEIGVQNGGSLETWKTFFTEARCLIGCDIDQRCGALQYDDQRVHVVVGDANQQNTIDRIKSICDNFDVVIDDGSHQSTDILNSFIRYFDLLKPGGIYVIEDAHTLYSSHWGGGILNEFSAYNFFKKIVDVINVQFWNSELSVDVYLRTFFPLGKTPSFIKEGWIESIEFRNSLIVIRKSIVGTNEKLGKRVITGKIAQVDNQVLTVRL